MFFQGFGHSSGQSPALPTPSSSETCCCRYLPASSQPRKLSHLVNSLLPHLDATMSQAIKTWASSPTPPKTQNKAPESGHARKYQDAVFIRSFQYLSHRLNSPLAAVLATAPGKAKEHQPRRGHPYPCLLRAIESRGAENCQGPHRTPMWICHGPRHAKGTLSHITGIL